MNESECSRLIESVEWTDPGNLISLSVLAFIDVLVIVGNCLVIAAVFCSHKLRSVTNFFIVSLAVADLLVGIAVLPFSATWEVFKVWIFGDVWCRIWLAVDVWMCTASILNLCAISLDRYVAVTRPVTYPSIMSTKRAKSLIAGIWVLSFVICFPPLVGWKDQKTQVDFTYRVKNLTLMSATQPPLPPPACPWTCELTNDAGYVVYSALGSFYIPMFVMLFFYWRIYKAAVRTTRAINQGFRTTKGSKGLRNEVNEERLTLRIHRGRGEKKSASLHQNTNNPNPSCGHVPSTPTSEYHTMSSSDANSSLSKRLSRSSIYRKTKPETIRISVSADNSTCNSLTPNIIETISSKEIDNNNENSDKFTFDIPARRDLSPKSHRRLGKRNIKLQVKKFRMETKAAKTLAIIVGGFIFCWLPFFSMYLLRAFCETCINPVLFSILFWLGYCNSAVNPVVYALFSKEFRLAFMKIICNIICKRQFVMTNSSSLQRRQSDGSQGRQRHSPCLTPVASPFIERSSDEIRFR